MKKSVFVKLALVAMTAAGAAWLVLNPAPFGASGVVVPVESGGKVYSCSMHPHIRESKPGICPVCQMKLAPFGAGVMVQGSTITLGRSVTQVIHLQTERVTRQSLKRSLRVAGLIEDNDTSHKRMSAYVDGRIEKLYINYLGAEVAAGQPLALMYSPTLYMAEREYVALLRQTVPTNFPAIVAEHDRAMNAAALKLKRLGLNQKQIEMLANKPEADHFSEVLAPISGTVVMREIYQGQYVKEGDKLFELADFSKMWFQFSLYEQDLAWVRPGQMVTVSTHATPGKEFTAPITFIDPTIDDKTRTAKVRVELDNPLIEKDGRKFRELYHKMYASAVVQVDVPLATVVPRSAVLSPGATPVVYIETGPNKYEPRKVRLGRLGDDGWEVLDGLEVGESVVLNGNLLLDSVAQLEQVPAVERLRLELLDAAQLEAATQLLRAIDRAGAALATDDLAALNERMASIADSIKKIQSASAVKGWEKLFTAFITPSTAAANLAVARQQFHPLSMAAAQLVRQGRRVQPTWREASVYLCPMVDAAVANAPKTGYWIQFAGPLQNPYMGKRMSNCGSLEAP